MIFAAKRTTTWTLGEKWKNNRVGLGELNEEALESANKDVRNFQEFLWRNDPVINYIVQSSCTKKRSKSKEKTVLTSANEDDTLFQNVIQAEE
ncbi:unnamed protein product [Didymodactylos carnosus]|uniref:Uncharacterized protein n=1 Tax=Didymodactylos carnosus TaxID=1234261 RepID=A0A814AMD4_9BILA|nr:unnamed protein product [Didymodactylos carnosus]CAF0959923.1 unnamed protein product [Didymodactylos carnosus]CAF3697395.1 unnamed protein product [Didymodactylos carnosus]CAF3732795.1 unnamed protein product [Didymodactylos carnosus]